MNNRNLLIIAVVVVILVIVGIFAFMMPHNNTDTKLNTQINFLSQDTLKNGEAVQFELKDTNGNPVAGENVTILFEENGVNQTYTIITDNGGNGSLVLNNEAPGTYNVYVSYNGSATYNGCSASKTITIEEGAAEVSTSTSTNSTESGSSEPIASNSSAGTSLYNGNSSSSQNLHYDSQYNFYYDDNGIIRGGQSDGMSADYVRSTYESGNMVDDEGNLQ